MHTGPEGLTVAELIEKANSLGLAEPAWEPTTSKKSHLSTVSASSHCVVVSSPRGDSDHRQWVLVSGRGTLHATVTKMGRSCPLLQLGV